MSVKPMYSEGNLPPLFFMVLLNIYALAEPMDLSPPAQSSIIKLMISHRLIKMRDPREALQMCRGEGPPQPTNSRFWEVTCRGEALVKKLRCMTFPTLAFKAPAQDMRCWVDETTGMQLGDYCKENYQ